LRIFDGDDDFIRWVNLKVKGSISVYWEKTGSIDHPIHKHFDCSSEAQQNYWNLLDLNKAVVP
jgi:hypothetical protein